MKHKPKYPPGAKTVQLFAGAPDGHAAFTTLLCLDTSSAMMSHVLLHYHLTAPDALPILRSKPVKSAAPDFKVKSVKPLLHAMHGMAHRCRCMSGLRQALTPSSLSRCRRTGSRLDLTIIFLLDLIDTIFITFSLSMYSCSDLAPCGSLRTSPGLLRSLGAKPLVVLRHRMMHRRQSSCLHVITVWYVVHKLEFALHRTQAGVRPSPQCCRPSLAFKTWTSRVKRYIKYTQHCHSRIIQV